MLRIEQRHASEMIAHAIEDDPDECCGILAGKDQAVSELYRVTNTAHSPYRYLMDPQEQLNAMLDSESKGWDLLAFYHSHTASEAYPSVTDIKLVPPADLFDYLYVIVSLAQESSPVIRSFHIVDQKVEETGVDLLD